LKVSKKFTEPPLSLCNIENVINSPLIGLNTNDLSIDNTCAMQSLETERECFLN